VLGSIRIGKETRTGRGNEGDKDFGVEPYSASGARLGARSDRESRSSDRECMDEQKERYGHVLLCNVRCRSRSSRRSFRRVDDANDVR
jgi:hypothetical protein